MSSTRKLVILGAVVLGLIVVGGILSRAALSHPLVDSDHILIRDTYELSGEADSSLVVLADAVDLNAGSLIPDDAALVARNRGLLDGQIQGDLTAMGDQLTLGRDATVLGDASFMAKDVTLAGTVHGDVTVIGEILTIGPSAKIDGDVTACVTSIVDNREDAPRVQQCSDGPNTAQFTFLQSLRDGSVFNNGAGSGFSAVGLLFSLFGALSLTGLSALAVALFPRHFSYLTEAVKATPRALAGMGCMTLVVTSGVGAGVTLALAKIPVLGLLLLPFGLIFGILIFAMVMTGWITLALLLGDWLVRRLVQHTLPPLITVVMGSAALMVLWYALSLLPFGWFIGFLVMVLLGAVGLGATLTTVMGTRALRRSHFVQG